MERVAAYAVARLPLTHVKRSIEIEPKPFPDLPPHRSQVSWLLDYV